MNSILYNRYFCGAMSMFCAWFMYQDLSASNKINILNLFYFICFTFLALYKKKQNTKMNQEYSTPQLGEIKKDIISEITEEKELQLTKTFKK